MDAVAIADGIVSVSSVAVGEADPPRRSFSAAETRRILNVSGDSNAPRLTLAKMSMSTTADGTVVEIQPKVVDAGHHQRRLIRLTGLDVEENQARRLLNDLDEFRARSTKQWADEEMYAHE